MFFFVSSVSCSVILIAGNWDFLKIEKCQNCYCDLELFWHNNIFAKASSKMAMVSWFSFQNDGGLQVLNVVLWENLILVLNSSS